MVASYQEEAGDLLQPSRQEKFESTTSFKDKRNKSVKFLDQKLTREERKRQKGGSRKSLHKQARQKGGPCLFKDLETSVQVLGINGGAFAKPPAVASTAQKGKTAAANLDVDVRKRLRVDDSVTSSEEAAARVYHPHRQNHHHHHHLQKRTAAAPVPPATGRFHTSRPDDEEIERARWRASLDNVIAGEDDPTFALDLARSQASDLKDQLLYWQTPPDSSWPAREEVIKWFHQALVQLNNITTGLQQHGLSWDESQHVKLYTEILEDVEKEVCSMALMCSEALKEGLQTLGKAPQDQDLRTAIRMSIGFVRLTIQGLQHRLVPKDGGNTFVRDLGQVCSELVVSVMEATADFQESLLQPSALTLAGKEVSVHEVSVRCTTLQSAWQKYADIVVELAAAFPEQAPQASCDWCKLMLRAASYANEMQRNLPWYKDLVGRLLETPTSVSGFGDMASASGTTTGVWGVPCGQASEMSTEVGDEDLQAQGWLPACLTALLLQAQNAAAAAMGPEDQGGSGTALGEAGGAWAACEELMHQLSDGLYELALTNTHRVGAMCLSPYGLACWALELLEEQACQALVFVRDLDRSMLGCGMHGLTHYKELRAATDILVNSILKVRRLLKQKRTTTGDDGVPRPLPVINRSESQSSLTSQLKKQEAARSPQRASPHKGMQATKTPKPGWPPLSNGHSKTTDKQDSGPGSHRVGDGKSARAPQENGVRRMKSRRSHGRDTPPIPEEAEAELASPGSSGPVPPGSPPAPARDGAAQPSDASQNGDIRPSLAPPTSDTPAASSQNGHRAFSGAAPPIPGTRAPERAREVSAVADGETPRVPGGISAFAAAPMTPFARQRLSSGPSLGSPLAVFSSDSDSTSCNSLMPAGSSSTFKFGEFSPPSSPTPRMYQSPFAAASMLPHRSSSNLAQPREPSTMSSNTSRGSGNGAATPKSRARDVASPMESFRLRDGTGSGRAMLQDRLLSNREPDIFAGALSDPTSGFHYLHTHPIPHLARASGEGSRNESDSGRDRGSEASTSRSSQGNSQESSAELVLEEEEEDHEALVFPWEGEPFWQIKWADLHGTLRNCLGGGSFGKVFKAYYDKSEIAVKFITIEENPTVPSLQRALLKFKQEVDLHISLKHNNIVKFKGACCDISSPHGNDPYDQDKVILGIAMELCRNGTLFRQIETACAISKLPPEMLHREDRARGMLPRNARERDLMRSPAYRLYSQWHTRVAYLIGAAAALEHMHQHNISHRDLTSTNLLVTENWEAKVADFNLSRAFEEEMAPSSGNFNSPQWCCPERLSGKPYSLRLADVFSFGVVLWEMITLKHPWRDLPPQSTPTSVLSTSDHPSSEGGLPHENPMYENRVPEYESSQVSLHVNTFAIMARVTSGERLPFPPLDELRPAILEKEGLEDQAGLEDQESIGQRLIDLATDCWRQDPEMRPSMSQVKRRLESIASDLQENQERLKKQTSRRRLVP